MTALQNPEPLPGSSQRPSQSGPSQSGQVMRVRDQGELIAAIPAMIGFHPRESLVLLATGGPSGRRLGLRLRIDLPPPEHVEYDVHVEVVAHSAVRALLKDSPVGAVVVVIGSADSRGGADPPPHPRLVALVVDELERRSVDVHTVLWAESTTAGACWACYDPCGCTGLVPDPSATPFMAATVAEGHVVHADRVALERIVAPVADLHLRRRERLLLDAVDSALAGPELGGRGRGGGIDTAAGISADIAAVDAAVADAEAGALVLDDERVVALAMALANPAVRDMALLWCAGPRAAAAEHLWAALVRETPDPEAAEPATLLTVSALLRGDGALANVALDRAERAWPGHRLSGLLRVAVTDGLRPSHVREWLRASRRSIEEAAGGSAR
jgi:Domain of unknown function (DUF4192)